MIWVIKYPLLSHLPLSHNLNDRIMTLYIKSLEEFKNSIWGYSPIFIIGQSCLGSAAAMFILMNGSSVSQMLQLFVVTLLCMGFNASVLSQQKPKTVLNLFVASVLTSLLLIVLNIP